jgi:hypothetical protein
MEFKLEVNLTMSINVVKDYYMKNKAKLRIKSRWFGEITWIAIRC